MSDKTYTDADGNTITVEQYISMLEHRTQTMSRAISAMVKNANDALSRATKVEYVGQLTPGLCGSAVCLSTQDDDGFPMMVRGLLTAVHGWDENAPGEDDDLKRGIEVTIAGRAYLVEASDPCTIDDQDDIESLSGLDGASGN